MEIIEKVDALTEEVKKREEYCAGLESLAQFLRTHPQLQLPDSSLSVFLWSKEDFQTVARAMGYAEKHYSDYYATLTKEFGPVKYSIQISREKVCERKVIGKKIVAAQAAYLMPAVEEHEEDIVEWDCEPFLASDQPRRKQHKSLL